MTSPREARSFLLGFVTCLLFLSLWHSFDAGSGSKSPRAGGGGLPHTRALHGALRHNHSFASAADATAAAAATATIFPPAMNVWCPHSGKTHKALSAHSSGRLVIDVGAFDGEDALAYARQGHRVLSFEPSPSKSGRIRRRLEAASVLLDYPVTDLRRTEPGKVRFFPFALSNSSGTAKFTVNKPTIAEDKLFLQGGSGDADDAEYGSQQDAFAVPWGSSGRARGDVQLVDVPVRRLDDLLLVGGRRGADGAAGSRGDDADGGGGGGSGGGGGGGGLLPDGEDVLLLKVDAQGFDYQVLQGALRLIRGRRIQVIMTELAVGLMPEKGKTALEMLRFLAENGYYCARCNMGSKPRVEQDTRGVTRTAESYVKSIEDMPFEFGGVNHGDWDNIVCLAGALGDAPQRAA